MQPTNRWRRFIPLSTAGALVFFGFLWLFDFPKPTVDDLFLCGAGLHLAEGGDFSNPLLVRQEFPSHLFFVQPPLHSYVLAGWLKIFGISSRSMTGFQGALHLLTAVATIALLRRHRAPVWLEWLVPISVSAAFLNIGLRPEPLAIGLTMAGFALIECNGKGKIALFFGFLLMFLGASTAPRTAPFTAGMIILAGYDLWRCNHSTGWRRWACCGPGLSALLVAFLVFLLLIDFRLVEFWRTFHFHAAGRVGGNRVDRLLHFSKNILGITQWPVFPVALALLLLALRQPLTGLARIGLCLACFFVGMAALGSLGHGAAWFAILGLLVLTTAVLQQITSRSQAIMLSLLVSGTLLVADSRNLIAVFGILTGKIHAELVGSPSEAFALRSTPEHPVLVDSSVARYVFDYRLPPGFIDFQFAAPFPGTLAADTTLRTGDIFVLGPPCVENLKRKQLLDLPVPKWSPLGLSRWSFDEYPRQAYLIRAEDCKHSQTNLSVR